MATLNTVDKIDVNSLTYGAEMLAKGIMFSSFVACSLVAIFAVFMFVRNYKVPDLLKPNEK